MPQICSICRHQRRLEIDQAMLDQTPLRAIAGQYGISRTALGRHRAHIPQALAKTHEAQELAQAGTLMEGVQVAQDRAERLYAAAEEILRRALEASDLRTALQAIRAAVDVMGEARGYMQLQGEISGELNAPNQTAQTLYLILPRVQIEDVDNAGGDRRTITP